MNRSRKATLLRGGAAASLAEFTALTGHVTAGGAMPGALGIAVPWVLSLAVCVLLAGRRLSALRLGASVAASQFLFHLLFTLGASSPSATGAVTGHLHGAASLPLPTGSAAALPPDGAMWISHALVAIVTTIALHRGERLLTALSGLALTIARWLRRRIATVPRTLHAHARALPAIAAREFRYADAPLRATLRGRAPPVVTV